MLILPPQKESKSGSKEPEIRQNPSSQTLSNPFTRRIQLILAFDGTRYSGWQVQPNGLSIQTLVQKSLETVLRHSIALTGAGRTDAGVHAEGQSAHFDTALGICLSRLRYSANALLPTDIRILEAKEVPQNFHARYSATGKIYHYHLQLDPAADPTRRLYRTLILSRLDLDRLQKGASLFIGTQDFAAFANESYKGAASKDSIRTLRRLEMVQEPGGLRLEFEGDGFLYKMVRNIVGTLIEIGKNQREPEEIPLLLQSRDRRRAGPTAPAQGLFLMKVLYE